MANRALPLGTVLYLGGIGRSGSTLLERLLAQCAGTVAVGELRSLWQQQLEPLGLCGCRLPIPQCPFWTSVTSACGVDARAALDAQQRVDRMRNLPLLFAPRLWPPFARRLHRYAALLERLYACIGSQADSPVVVDSSKWPSTALILMRLRGVDVRMVHLVRDSRGNAYSWAKRMAVDSRTDAPPMARESTARAAVLWSAYNLIFSALRMTRIPVLRVHYEDLVAEPATQLARVTTFAGLDADFRFLSATTATMDQVSHSVAGNPVRFVTGPLPIRLDDEWRRSLPATDRRLVTLVTFPGLLRYGYLGGNRRPSRLRKDR